MSVGYLGLRGEKNQAAESQSAQSCWAGREGDGSLLQGNTPRPCRQGVSLTHSWKPRKGGPTASPGLSCTAKRPFLLEGFPEHPRSREQTSTLLYQLLILAP